AAFEQVADVQLASDLPDVHGPALVGKGGIARGDGKGLEAGQRRDQVLYDAVGEVVAARIAAEIGKGQHGQPRIADVATRYGRRAGVQTGEAIADPRDGDDPVVPVGPRTQFLAEASDLDSQ